MSHSFTKALSKVLEELLEKNPEGFPTSRLYREIYHKWTYPKAKPFLFDQSRYSRDKIWLRPQEKPRMSKDCNQGPGNTFLKLTLRLNEEPGNVMMNQLAMALQYLPNVDEVRFNELYAPRNQIEDFMLRIYQANKLRPLVRKLHAKRQLKRLKASSSGQDAIKNSSKYVTLLLDQKTHLTCDWSSAMTDQQSVSSFFHRDRAKSLTWPRGMRRSDTKSWSNRFFSTDYKSSISDHESVISRVFPRRAKTTDGSNLANGTFPSFAPSHGSTHLSQRNRWIKHLHHEETWHLLMWLVMIYILGSMCRYMGN